MTIEAERTEKYYFIYSPMTSLSKKYEITDTSTLDCHIKRFRRESKDRHHVYR